MHVEKRWNVYKWKSFAERTKHRSSLPLWIPDDKSRNGLLDNWWNNWWKFLLCGRRTFWNFLATWYDWDIYEVINQIENRASKQLKDTDLGLAWNPSTDQESFFRSWQLVRIELIQTGGWLLMRSSIFTRFTKEEAEVQKYCATSEFLTFYPNYIAPVVIKKLKFTDQFESLW